MTADPGSLARRLGLRDAVVIGLGSMIGAGVFSVFAPAAAAAGTGLLVGLVLAGVIAYLNATASAQLAAQYPTSGGTYVYGRERLGSWPGFIAGWSFVIGKTASCAVMALTVGAYLAPAGWDRAVAVSAVLGVAVVNSLGVTRTAGLARVIVVVVLLVLAVIVASGVWGEAARGIAWSDVGLAGWHGVLQSAGLLFFAFAGYARIATMGEEVTQPERNIPRAIFIALSVALVVYAAVGITVLGVLGPDVLASSPAPAVAVVADVGWGWAEPLVRLGAVAASLGALLALMAGVSRTVLAMARTGDLPVWLASVHPRHRVPRRAEVALAVVVCGVVLLGDLRGVVGFSSFGVLLYYAVANAAAFTQTAEHRRHPRWQQIVGVAGCLLLVVTLPWHAVVTGMGMLVVGIAYRVIAHSVGRRSSGAV